VNIILVADNDLSRIRGLMHHRPILKEECAFFEFSREGQHCFWNNNVDFPISLIFCNKDGIVSDIKYLEAQQKNTVRPDSFDVKYVIEAHVNAPKIYKIKKGLKMKRDNKEVFFKWLIYLQKLKKT